MRQVLLTVDYEIFGNGGGDVIQHVIDPTTRMARLCREREMPLTVFFEAEEYVAFVKYAGALQKKLGYDPAALMREQAAALLRQGHDLQLHLHPEWHGASYENGGWLLRPDQTTVDELFATEEEATQYIGQRKKLVEALTPPDLAPHPVRVYRAGAFSAQPGRKLLAALARNEMGIDSSVVKGLHHRHGDRFLDYRAAPSAKGPWRVKDQVDRADPSGPVWEFPIHSVMGRRFQQITWSRLSAKFSRNVPKQRQKEMIQQFGLGANPMAWLKFLWQPVPIKLDFHNVSPVKLLRWIKSAPAPAAGLPDVVVLIGHTKEHIDDRQFARLLDGIAGDPALKVIRFGDLAREMRAALVEPSRPPSGAVGLKYA